MTENLITKVTKVIPKIDGSEVRIVAEQMTGLGLHSSINVYVSRRKTPDDHWSLLSDCPHPNWKSMSVADYERYGRSEVLQAVSPGEILAVASLIGKPLL